jgi:hypothetical protein
MKRKPSIPASIARWWNVPLRLTVLLVTAAVWLSPIEDVVAVGTPMVIPGPVTGTAPNGMNAYAAAIDSRDVGRWAAVTLTLLFFTLDGHDCLRKRLERQRVRGGLCAACAYDLRASPNCCPECGQSGGHPTEGPPIPPAAAGERSERKPGRT